MSDEMNVRQRAELVQAYVIRARLTACWWANSRRVVWRLMFRCLGKSNPTPLRYLHAFNLCCKVPVYYSIDTEIPPTRAGNRAMRCGGTYDVIATPRTMSTPLPPGKSAVIPVSASASGVV